MSDDIFRTEAPKFWALNLPVIPVEGNPHPHRMAGHLGGIPTRNGSELIAADPGNNIACCRCFCLPPTKCSSPLMSMTTGC